jgi:hypothetical protein
MYRPRSTRSGGTESTGFPQSSRRFRAGKGQQAVLALQDGGLVHTSLQPCFSEPLSVCIQHGTVPAGRARRQYRRYARRCSGEDVGHRLTAHRIPEGAIPWATR